MALRVCFLAVFFCTTALLFSQENPARLSVAAPPTSQAATTNPPATSNPIPATQASPATNSPATSNPQPAPTASGPATNVSPEGSNLTDAPLPEVANQPKVIPPGQTQTTDGPKGPRDGHWYVSGFGGAMVEQFQVNATSTAIGQQPLDQGPSGRLGSYAGFKVGYDFAVRDVQLAFGGPTPMRTAMEIEGSYLGAYEKIPLYNVSTGGPTVGYETYNLSAYSVLLNGLIKFEDLPVTPYFGGGVGVVFMTASNHKMDVNGVIAGTSTAYSTAIGSGQNTSLALQAVVGLERRVYENLFVFVEYKFLAFLDVKFAYGNEPTTAIPPVAGGSNSQNDFMANQILSAGVKWSF